MTTYEEYLELRRQLGYPDEFAMLESIWSDCDHDAQENMLNQFRSAVQTDKDIRAARVEMAARERAVLLAQFPDAW